MKRRVSLMAGLLAVMCIFSASAHADGGGAGLDVRPPPPRVLVFPKERPGFVWTSGYWRWSGRRHVWVNGRWIRARPGWHWVGAHWEEHRGRYHFVKGYWAR